jgi:hypothetical protein
VAASKGVSETSSVKTEAGALVTIIESQPNDDALATGN